MNCFIVISQNEEVLAAVPAKFPDHHYQILRDVWLVAATNKTASDICESLGIHGDNKREGVVFMAAASHSNGYFATALWEKLQLWEEL